MARGRAAARLVHVIGAMGFGMAFGATNGCWIGGDDGLGRWARHLGERPLAGLIDVFVVSWSGCAPSVDHGSGSGLGRGRRTAAALCRMAPLAASSLLLLSPLSRTRRPRPHRDDAPSAFALPQPARTETAGIVRHADYVVDMAATHAWYCSTVAAPPRLRDAASAVEAGRPGSASTAPQPGGYNASVFDTVFWLRSLQPGQLAHQTSVAPSRRSSRQACSRESQTRRVLG